MSSASLIQLLLLAAIWGASFLFMRVAVPLLGPAWMIEWRVVLGALMLALIARWLRQPLGLRTHVRRYAMLGLFNTALPFILYAWAAQTLTASLLSVLNATAPIWGAVLERFWGGTPLSGRRLLGLVLGVGGVALLVGLDPAMLHPGSGLAVVAAVLAPLCYAIASQYARTAGAHAPVANAEGSMWGGAVLLLPLLAFSPFTPLPPLSAPGIWGAVLGLGLLCTGVAYFLYFRLIEKLGAASALTVGFLIPAFGILWGHVFLDEPLGWYTLLGTLIVLAGTALVTGFKPVSLWGRGTTTVVGK